MTDSTGTVRDWVRGWVRAHIPNEDAADSLVEAVTSNLTNGFNGMSVTPAMRDRLERHLGTADAENACTPADVVYTALLKRLPEEVARAAYKPLARRAMHEGEETWAVPIDEPLPRSIADILLIKLKKDIDPDLADWIEQQHEQGTLEQALGKLGR